MQGCQGSEVRLSQVLGGLCLPSPLSFRLPPGQNWSAGAGSLIPSLVRFGSTKCSPALSPWGGLWLPMCLGPLGGPSGVDPSDPRGPTRESQASLNFSDSSGSAHGWRPRLGPSAENRMWYQEVKESVGSGWGVASGRDFLKPDRFTTVSWAQDGTAVSYKCPCQSPGTRGPAASGGARAHGTTPPWASQPRAHPPEALPKGPALRLWALLAPL